MEGRMFERIFSPEAWGGFLAMVMLGLTGCGYRSIGEPEGRVAMSVPQVWAAVGENQDGKISGGWLDEFGDRRMKALVDEAMVYNQDLRALGHRLAAARQSSIIAGANRLPSVSGTTGYRTSGGNDREVTDSFSLSLSASWEADLWGRLRDLDLAERADYAATVADFRGARLSLAANVAQAWCNLITAEQQVELAKVTLQSYQQALPVIERRYKANTLRAVDVQFGRNNVASAARSLEARVLARNEAARALELLLGRYPAAAVKSSRDLPDLEREIPAGLPAGLLARRPDLAAARASLFASAKRADAAKKDLLPALRLTGGVSDGGTGSFRQVFRPDFLVWSVASSLSQSIYDGGAPTAAAKAALDRNRAEIEDYARLALRAFREVESALDADRSLRAQELFLRKEVEQTTLAEKRALSDITLGIEGASFLEYLEAQRRAENARASLIRLKNDRLQNRIDLHLALGGDFETEGK